MEAGRGRARAPSVSPGSPMMQDQFERLTARLRDEVQRDDSPVPSRRNSLSGGDRSTSAPGTTAAPSLAAQAPKRLKDLKALDRVAFLLGTFEHFKNEQNAYIVRLLAEGFVDDDELRLHKPTPSLYDQYISGSPAVASHVASAVRPSATQPVQRKVDKSVSQDSKGSQSSAESQSQAEVEQEKPVTSEDILSPPGGSKEVITGTMVLRMFSFIFVSLL